MNSHFQSSETTSTSSGGLFDFNGRLGSRSWAPIQAMPARRIAVRTGMPQTPISIAPEYSQSGRYTALVLPRRNHQATATVAIIVGMMIASMMAVELMRVVFLALAAGATRSKMPRLQAVSTREAGKAALASALRRRAP